jgi:glycosyltransferase involved in cell wall biosynthesis
VITLILPIHNKGSVLDYVFSDLQQLMQAYISAGEFRLLMINDGSTDNSAEVIERIRKEHNYVSVRSLPENKGKGFAIIEGLLMAEAQSRITGYLDADRDIDISIITSMIASIETGGSNLAIGSKYLPKSKISAPLSRRILSRVFRFLTRCLLDLKVSDTQTGIKLFDREFLHMCKNNKFSAHSFSFDLELLTLASKNNLNISEHPVTITKDFGGNVSFVSGMNALQDLMVLRNRYKSGD